MDNPIDANLIEQTGRAVLAAAQRIRNSVIETPLEPVSGPGAPASVRVLFKREDLQETGSFKLRGATSRILALSDADRARGIVAASNGNHGMGVAAAAAKIGIRAEVYVSSHVSPGKARKIEQYGAEVRKSGSDPLDAEIAGREAAEKSGRTFISPYNDPEVIAGQGSIVDVVERPTLSVSTSGGLEPGSVTLDICGSVIDHAVLVTEEEIRNTMLLVRDTHGWLMEGAAAAACAAFLKTAGNYEGKTVVVIICGGNVSEEVKKAIGV